MAAGATVKESETREEHLVIFMLAGEEFGIDIQHVNEIIRQQEITQIPRSARDIEGVINLRGRIIPILNLRERLGLPIEADTRATRIVVVETTGHTIGMIVDGVSGVLRLPGESIEPPSKLIADLDDDFVRGVGKFEERLIILLNLERALRLDEMEAQAA